MKSSNEQQKLVSLFVLGLLLCGTAHIFPSGLNILAAIVGFLFIGYFSVKSYELKKKEKKEKKQAEE
ncbi:hypothetical protein [Pseudobutyrivibrio sp.]|uniref:hypothetical protein n=1 Tax=Pseudobutyrivibrio sp. TaxID=2014367 RepID=UPI001D9A8AB0|nr:hypothetical protein [Pseudobutyrivibrio sp.]MBE5910739.1 hypothetical protein [Pseudobutyrivibrio sp.]